MSVNSAAGIAQPHLNPISLSIVVPCYNEAGSLAATIDDIEVSLDGSGIDFEVIIVNDGSTDATAAIARRLEASRSWVRALSNRENSGLGATYFEGVRAARNEYVMAVFGDNEIAKESLRDLFTHVGRAEMVVPYLTNAYIRPFHRQILSKLFTWLVNSVTGRSLRYYNGPVIHRRRNLLSLPLRTASFAYMAEAVTYLLDRGTPYVEVPYQMRHRASGKPAALRWNNCVNVLKTIALLSVRRARRVEAVPAWAT